MNRWNHDLASLLLRLVTGSIFVPHGYSKVYGAGGPASFAADMPGFGIPLFLGYIGAYAEFFGALLLIVGLLTRLNALLLAAMMGVAAFIVQLPDVLNEASNGVRSFAVIRGIELPLIMFGASLAIVFLGGGRWSLDGLLGIDRRLGHLLSKKKAAAEAAA